MKKIYKILFKYAIDEHKAGEVKNLELDEVELGRLTRRGCIIASKEAKLSKKEEEVVEVPVKSPKKKKVAKSQEHKPENVSKDVVSKKDSEQTKVQTRSTDKE